MHLLETLACAFFNTFGITQPDDQGRRRAAWFVLALLLFALAVIIAAGALVYRMLHL